jgi:hypothetical protein
MIGPVSGDICSAEPRQMAHLYPPSLLQVVLNLSFAVHAPVGVSR